MSEALYSGLSNEVKQLEELDVQIQEQHRSLSAGGRRNTSEKMIDEISKKLSVQLQGETPEEETLEDQNEVQEHQSLKEEENTDTRSQEVWKYRVMKRRLYELRVMRSYGRSVSLQVHQTQEETPAGRCQENAVGHVWLQLLTEQIKKNVIKNGFIMKVHFLSVFSPVPGQSEILGFELDVADWQVSAV